MIDIMDRATHIMRQETTPQQLTVKQCNIYIQTYIYTIYQHRDNVPRVRMYRVYAELFAPNRKYVTTNPLAM